MPELTVYTAADDGSVYGDATVYATAHDAASGTARAPADESLHIQNTKYTDNHFYPERAFLYFDTSSLPDTALITGAVLGLYCANWAQGDTGHSDIHVVEGVQDNPYNGGDYGDHHDKTVSGGSYPYPPVSGGYSEITLNAAGLDWINKAGLTRFCLRLYGDANGIAPTAQNQVTVYAADKGTGYKPKLVITYTEGELKTSGDAGSGIETIAARSQEISDPGFGAETGLADAFVTVGETGSGSEAAGIETGTNELLCGSDGGNGADAVKVLIQKAGSDLKLRGHQGQAGIPHKEVSL